MSRTRSLSPYVSHSRLHPRLFVYCRSFRLTHTRPCHDRRMGVRGVCGICNRPRVMTTSYLNGIARESISRKRARYGNTRHSALYRENTFLSSLVLSGICGERHVSQQYPVASPLLERESFHSSLVLSGMCGKRHVRSIAYVLCMSFGGQTCLYSEHLLNAISSLPLMRARALCFSFSLSLSLSLSLSFSLSLSLSPSLSLP